MENNTGRTGYFGNNIAQHIIDIIDINENNLQYVEPEFTPNKLVRDSLNNDVFSKT